MRLPLFQKCLLGLMLILLPLSGQTSEDKIRDARKAAIAWLTLIDQNKYEQSWEQTAQLFKQQVEADTWSKQLSGGRKPLGDVSSRILLNATYSTSLANAPDGEYVVIQFKTEFANKKNSVETVTPMLDGDRWRVAGYYVR
jgi:hypothetical protein